MKYEFTKMTVNNKGALNELLLWLDRQSTVFDNEMMTVFVDGNLDFCAIEYVNRPFEHTSKDHTLLECVCSPYVPAVVPLWLFRQRVRRIAER